MSGTEVLEVGDDRRSGPSRRVRLVLLVVAIVLAVVAFAVDRELREREAQEVAACAEAAADAVDLAGRRVGTTYGYVSPALSNSPDPVLKEGLFGLVAEAADGAAVRLEAPRRQCGDVTVFPLHAELRERRDRCVDMLDAQRSALQEVTGDGETVQVWLDAPRSC